MASDQQAYAQRAHQNVLPDNTAQNSDAPSHWSISNAPEPKGTLTDNNLNGVTCVSASDCWAIGAYQGDGGAYQTLTEHWDGTAWTIVDSPSSSRTRTNFLYGVACRSTSDCWAVGGSVNGSGNVDTLIEHWDGHAWAIVTSPNSVGGVSNINILSSVACSSTSCWAVGYSQNGNTKLTLIEQWNGSAWSAAISPNASVLADFLNYVTCTSDSDCVAVGASYNGQVYQTLIERWNGVAWTIAISANSSPISDNGLLSVTCLASSDCSAVGVFTDANGVYQSLIEHWDGTTWATDSSPTFATQNNELKGIACISSSNCWAVGIYQNSSNNMWQTLAEHWDGSMWTIVNSPDADTTEYNELAAVACTSTSNCLAVGFHNQVAFEQNLTEQWNGSAWTLVASLNHLPTQAWNTFKGVTCLSDFECWAVGFYSDTETGQLIEQTVTEYWNGVSWTIVPSANTSVDDTNHLLAVTCVATSDCWAVGEYQSPGNNSNTLIEHWDGSFWTVTNSPNARPNQINQLRSVTCASASECWAVGIYYDTSANVIQPLIERWDGTSWTLAASANTSSTQDTLLNGLTCASASNCWAVGYYNNGASLQTLIEQWNGTSWAIVDSPNASAPSWNQLQSVTCTSVSDCWAVGYYSAAGHYHTIAEHWDGNSWTLITSPDMGTSSDNFLNGVSCASASECWAVGYYNNNSAGTDGTLIELWNGTSWAVVSSPNTIGFSNELRTVACASAFQCMAVGEYANEGILHALTEFIAPVQLVGVVSRKTHGSVGTFDVDLTNGNGIECRSGGGNGDYLLVFTFVNPLANVDGVAITSGSGSVSFSGIGPNPNQYSVDLSGAPNAQRVTVTLANVTDSIGNSSGAISATMVVLVGDTNGDGFVNSADISQTKSQSGRPLTSSNFREDLNADGLVNSADISIVKSRSGTALP